MRFSEPVTSGDILGIIAPASPFDVEKYQLGIAVLKEAGFEIKEGRNLFQKKGYLAGTVKERLYDLLEMYNDPQIKGIIAARGGYGTMQLLSYLRIEDFEKKPKLFIGSSDLTALHLFLNFKAGIASIYGPMVDGDFGVAADETNMRVLRELMELPEEYEYPAGDLLVAEQGEGEGILVGGCLSIIVSLLGTPFEPDFNGKVIFLEDINEPPYRWDRMLTQLKLAGKFDNVKGLIISIADFTPYEANGFISDFFRGINVPVVTGFPAGHTVPSFSLPLGYMAKIDTYSRVFKVWKSS